jgi:hypothetical protein
MFARSQCEDQKQGEDLIWALTASMSTRERKNYVKLPGPGPFLISARPLVSAHCFLARNNYLLYLVAKTIAPRSLLRFGRVLCGSYNTGK